MANKIFQDDYLLLETDDFRNITARFNGFKRDAISPIKLLRQAKYKTMFFTLFEIELDGVNTRFIINGKSKNNTKFGIVTHLKPKYTSRYKIIDNGFDAEHKATITVFSSAFKEGFEVDTDNDGIVNKEQEKTILASMVRNCPALPIKVTYYNLRPKIVPPKTSNKVAS
jgi:hypothetical protein